MVAVSRSFGKLLFGMFDNGCSDYPDSDRPDCLDNSCPVNPDSDHLDCLDNGCSDYPDSDHPDCWVTVLGGASFV